MASEDCLELCIVGHVLGGNYVWCLVIVVMLMRFGQAGAKRCGGLFKVMNWDRKPQEVDSFYKIKEVLTMSYCCIETLLQVLLGTSK